MDLGLCLTGWIRSAYHGTLTTFRRLKTFGRLVQSTNTLFLNGLLLWEIIDQQKLEKTPQCSVNPNLSTTYLKIAIFMKTLSLHNIMSWGLRNCIKSWTLRVSRPLIIQSEPLYGDLCQNQSCDDCHYTKNYLRDLKGPVNSSTNNIVWSSGFDSLP